jgi:hypothetical protein
MVQTRPKVLKAHLRGVNVLLSQEVLLLSEDESWDDGEEDDWTDDEWGEDDGWGEDEEW